MKAPLVPSEEKTSLHRFVAVSEIFVPDAGRSALDEAFAHRLGAVDHWPGFRDLEVWADKADPCRLVMVSWWDSQECFASYMRSEEHGRSHERIPTGEHRPRPRGFRRYTIVAR